MIAAILTILLVMMLGFVFMATKLQSLQEPSEGTGMMSKKSRVGNRVANELNETDAKIDVS
jgi:hypothetical protein